MTTVMRAPLALPPGLPTAELRSYCGFDSSPIGMALLQLDGRFLLGNPALLGMLGCDEAALADMTVATLSHPATRRRATVELGRLLSGELSTVRAERHFLRPDGEVMWALINVSLVRDVDGRPDHYFAHFLDITDRVRAEQEAERRVIEQSTLTEFGARALEGADLGAMIDHAVRAVASCLATKAAALWEIGGPDDLVLASAVGCSSGRAAKHLPSADQTLARYTVEATEPVLVADLREERRFSAPPLLIDHGLISGLSVAVRVNGRAHGVLSAHSSERDRFHADDANFLLTLANALATFIERRYHEDAQERLGRQDRLAAMGQLAAGVAHDFNNIVGTIGVYADLIGSIPLDASTRQHLGVIREQTERAKSLIWQVLDFAEGSPIVRSQVDLGTFFAGLLPVLRRILPTRISVTLHHDPEPYVVSVDPARLQQIVMNLVTNARDAMAGTGQLTILLSRRLPSAGRPGPHDPPLWGPGVYIQVTDSGSGFAPHTLTRALEPFFTTKGSGEGTGLGLAQVHSLVSQHDGHLAIDSREGTGTTVTIWLPEQERRQVRGASAPGAAAPQEVGAS